MSLLRLNGLLLSRKLISHQSTFPKASGLLQKITPISGHLYQETMHARGHKNFGHKPDKTPNFTKCYHYILLTLFMIAVLDWKGLKKALFPKVDAHAGNSDPVTKDSQKSGDWSHQDDAESSSDENSELDDGKKKSKKGNKVGFRDRKIIEYENRIRLYSTPDKAFRYFATIRLISSDGTTIYMTPDDFLRSFFPGMRQPDGLGLDQYRRYDPKSVTERLDLQLEENSIFYKLGSYGLITFSDYIFLLTVLSTSKRHFEIAFQMFDLNGDGNVDCEEFEKVATLVRQQTSIGNRHRDHSNTGNTFKGVNSALTTYFFGPNLDQKLTIEKFLDFQHQLQREIISLEFSRKNPDDNGHITEADFAELLLAYAGYPSKIKQKKLKRVKRKFREEKKGISKKDYLDFFHFLNNINDVDIALTFYHIAGASIDPATLKHVAMAVAAVSLSDHVVDVIFTIFDDNMDGQLSNKEFISVMKDRLQRGLEKPKDTGFIKFIQSVIRCAKETKPAVLE